MRSEADPTAIEWLVEESDIGNSIAGIALREARIYELNEEIYRCRDAYELRGKLTVDEYLDKIEPLLQELYALVADRNTGVN